MMNFLLIMAIAFLALLPLIIVYGIQQKKGRNRHIIVTYSSPDGQLKATPVKIGFSWTIFFFNGWALLFRGQFLEFLINFFGSAILSMLGLFALVGFTYSSYPDGTTLFDLFNLANGWEIFGWVVFYVLSAALNYYYILYGNKLRLRRLYKRGFSFDNGQNENVEDIYAYIGEQPRTANQVELKPGVVQGQTHQYVVPDEEQVVDLEEKYDYSNLTIQDLKLLLKSEGISFSASSTKEELLDLVEENIAKKQREEDKKEKEQYIYSPYFKLTVQELVEELDKRNIKYLSSMRKADLVKLLIEDDKKQ